VTDVSARTTALTQARRRAGRLAWPPEARAMRVTLVLVGVAALMVYVLPGLPAPAAHWPMWDIRVYGWGGRQAAAGGGALYVPGTPFSFTYPPFAALLFAGASVGALKIALTAGSLVALPLLCGQSLAAAGVRLRAETVFAVSALALLTWPVAYTLHLGEVNLILAALIGADLLRPRGGSGPPPQAARPAGSSPAGPAERRDGTWWQGIGTGLAAGIKLTPLIFVVYLLFTRRVRAAVTAAVTFAVTIAAGFLWLPAWSRAFWLGGVFYDQTRVGNPANPSDQSLGGAIARLAGTGDPPRTWWLVAALAVGVAGLAVAGLAVAVWAHRRGYRLGGFVCCAVTGLLVSPISWTHHWVWDIPLLVWLTTAAWRRFAVGRGGAGAVYAPGVGPAGAPGAVRAAGALVAAAGALVAAAIFSDYTPIPWPGHPADAGRMVASDLYVLFGLGVLVAMGVVLGKSRAGGAGLAGRGRGAEPGVNGGRRPGDQLETRSSARAVSP
jgi:alpha-1,2-mannosyltransferase